ncbi:hypothetical protein HPSA20_1578 [Helicobacter pylori SouthAfrica20]|uniref:Uncharacterized protein n=1 Tax=Helicobacter pylori SouthAfrica20 TaxID=1352356 RepID=T1UBN5_HELPX|nr:hypothetical protein HPSA20_1578 [Helicobacter pylori SouthAfrica20]
MFFLSLQTASDNTRDKHNTKLISKHFFWPFHLLFSKNLVKF